MRKNMTDRRCRSDVRQPVRMAEEDAIIACEYTQEDGVKGLQLPPLFRVMKGSFSII